jgi:2',3'-cyclic-nucleotide 2'-phosphodiesterase/3'-nucleotidase
VSPARILVHFACALCSFAERTKVSVLVTTDLHGNLYPHDYFSAKPAERGLAKIATLIRQERTRNANTLVIDCGDTIQGAPPEAVFQTYRRAGKLPFRLRFEGRPLDADPMMLAMSRIGFDAMVVGNHEYNFGLANLERARKDATFPWLSANTVVPDGVIEPFAPYLIKTTGGVKVAIIGITTPAVPSWEKPENYKGLRFLPGVEAVQKALSDLRAKHKPDLVLVAAHAALDRDLKTGAVRAGETGFENMVYQIAKQVSGLDAIVFGHSHQQLEEYILDGVLLHQPRNFGMSVGRVEFDLEREGNGAWRVISKSGKLLPVTAAVAADPEILELAKPYHELAERYLNTPVAESPDAMDGSLARVMDTALVDAVHRVQLHYSKADVSLTALFNPGARFPKGPITVRQIAALYIYDNELYAIEGNGRMLREALENSARYFLSCADEGCSQGPLINRDIIGFNYDMAQGVEYEIDLTRPAGERVRNLRFRGKPLDDAQPLRIALNNYRAAGSAGYSMFRDARVIYKSGVGIRELIVDYYSAQRKLPANPDGNWRIVPEAARMRLLEEARREAARAAAAMR